jgi:hypothetical protein
MNYEHPTGPRAYQAPALTRHGDVGVLTQNLKQVAGNYDGSVSQGKALKTA